MEMDNLFNLLIGALLWFCLNVIPCMASLYGLYYMLSLPLKRQERARLFVEILERGLKQGQTPEEVISGVAAYRDLSLGSRFHTLALRLRRGEKLQKALAAVDVYLPNQILAILRAGIETGNLQKVLPATQKLLRDACSKMQSVTNYFVLLCLSFVPVLMAVFLLVNIVIMPKFMEISQEMTGDVNLALVSLQENVHTINLILSIVSVGIVTVVIAYAGGERFKFLFNLYGFQLIDWIEFFMPWKNKRLKRDFSTMLSILLDIGMTEERAVQLSAKSTANTIFRRRAQRVIHKLHEGENLTEAIRYIDSTGEFHWRLRNATHVKKGFLEALRGWHDYLDAKAYQQEQASAQLITTFIVLVNGAIVGLFATGVFYTFIMIMDLVAE